MSFGGVQPTDSAYNYPEHYRFAWAAALNSIEPLTTGGTFSNYQTAVGDMVLTDHLVAASAAVAGNPYTGVVAQDPGTALASLWTMAGNFLTKAIALTDANLTDVMAAAVAEYDTHAGSTQIENVIDAVDAASLADHLESVGRVHASLWASRAMMGSQAFVTVAQMEHARQQRLNEDSFKLRLFGERERTTGILQLTEALLRQRALQVDAYRAATVSYMDAARLDVTMRQDKIEHDTEMEVRAQTWDLDLFSYHHQGLSAIAGASTIPRAQTARERLAAGTLNSANMALQVGMATGSLEYGAIAGVVGLGLQLYGMS